MSPPPQVEDTIFVLCPESKIHEQAQNAISLSIQLPPKQLRRRVETIGIRSHWSGSLLRSETQEARRCQTRGPLEQGPRDFLNKKNVKLWERCPRGSVKYIPQHRIVLLPKGLNVYLLCTIPTTNDPEGVHAWSISKREFGAVGKDTPYRGGHIVQADE